MDGWTTMGVEDWMDVNGEFMILWMDCNWEVNSLCGFFFCLGKVSRRPHAVWVHVLVVLLGGRFLPAAEPLTESRFIFDVFIFFYLTMDDEQGGA